MRWFLASPTCAVGCWPVLDEDVLGFELVRAGASPPRRSQSSSTSPNRSEPRLSHSRRLELISSTRSGRVPARTPVGDERDRTHPRLGVGRRYRCHGSAKKAVEYGGSRAGADACSALWRMESLNPDGAAARAALRSRTPRRPSPTDGSPDDDNRRRRHRVRTGPAPACRFPWSLSTAKAEERIQRFLDAVFELIDEKGATEFTPQEVIECSGQLTPWLGPADRREGRAGPGAVRRDHPSSASRTFNNSLVETEPSSAAGLRLPPAPRMVRHPADRKRGTHNRRPIR